jgi:hypothetical protein
MARGASGGLNQTRRRPQVTFLVSVENRHEKLPECPVLRGAVDPHQHIKIASAQRAQYFHPFIASISLCNSEH